LNVITWEVALNLILVAVEMALEVLIVTRPCVDTNNSLEILLVVKMVVSVSTKMIVTAFKWSLCSGKFTKMLTEA
jgi:hypothetical protein